MSVQTRLLVMILKKEVWEPADTLDGKLAILTSP